MKILIFTLSIPNVGSWDGKWISSDKCFAIKKKVSDDLAKKIMNGSTKSNNEVTPSVSFSYNFGDGWRASVKVIQTNAREADKIMRKSQGFAGYDWMVDSILLNQEIVSK